MPNLFTTITAAGLFAAVGLASASTVYAEQNPAPDSSGSQMGTDMRHGGMMGQMSQRMEGCSTMMQSRNQRPNSQFHKPSEPRQEQ